ncbi:AhpC/TSA-family protein [Bordetella ansorpii]|uniref:Glutathione-dependent peroxiredoxin n=1 Tax=Bordetella ansorpii TaxID=288768 RepID=A0A157SFH9_9BORD|nr:peroxiredoxin [Bordetella ansorpii]SAI69208.1 AhpC/TSA-family protein [Bordetella ansorpii]
MTIKVGDRVPEGTLTEFIETETEGCQLGPNAFQVSDLVRGKKIALFAVPGAFTPTCSAKHLPGFVAKAEQLREKGVDEVWCVSVNDAFVMGAWGREQQAAGKVRMLADGSALWTRELGLELDLTQRGMGVRSQRYSALIEDGVVKALNVEAPGKFEVSDVDTMLSQA